MREPERGEHVRIVLLVAALRIVAAVSPKPAAAPPSRVYVLPPASPGSLGDEAYVAATIEAIARRGMEPVVLTRRSRDRWSAEVDRLGHVALGRYFRSFPRGLWSFARRLRRDDALVYLAVDVAEGTYDPVDAMRQLALVHLAAARGARSLVISLSIGSRPNGAALDVMRRLPSRVEVAVRDRQSSDRAARLLHRRVLLGADPAFLLADASTLSEAAEQTLAWIAARRSAGRRVLGVNLSAQTAGTPSPYAGAEAAHSVEAHVELVASACEAVAAEHAVAFLGIPHDWRGQWSDAYLVELLVERLAQRTREDTAPMPPVTAKELRRVCRALDGVLAERMHLAIACICVGTPVVAVSYHDKFAALFTELGLSSSKVIHPDTSSVRELAARLVELLDPKLAASARAANGAVEAARARAESCIDLLLRTPPKA